jgi:hypothetical protein
MRKQTVLGYYYNMNLIILNKKLNFSTITNLSKEFQKIKEPTTLKFKKGFAQPAGITLLSSLINSKREFIQIEYENTKDINYLQRTNFFKNLGFEIEEQFKRDDNANNLLECTKILDDDDPYEIDMQLKQILESHIEGKPNLVLGILLTVYEVVDNILEHSTGEAFKQSDRAIKTPAFVSAQYYNNRNNHIEIGISDWGKGIVDTLTEEYSELSREEVLLKAFELNTTRHRKFFPSRGNGLAKLKHFVLLSSGSIRCRTNEFEITFSPLYPNGNIEKIEPMIGTHFEIMIGCYNDIDTNPIFEIDYSDYEDNLDDFFD